LRKFVRLLLKGDVGLETGVLMRQPAMQLNHVVSSSEGSRRNNHFYQ
jgi:hypothetical protein